MAYSWFGQDQSSIPTSWSAQIGKTYTDVIPQASTLAQNAAYQGAFTLVPYFQTLASLTGTLTPDQVTQAQKTYSDLQTAAHLEDISTDADRNHNEDIFTGQLNSLMTATQALNSGWMAFYSAFFKEKINDQKVAWDAVYATVAQTPLTISGYQRLMSRKNDIVTASQTNWLYVVWGTLGAVTIVPLSQWALSQAKEHAHKKIKKKLGKED